MSEPDFSIRRPRWQTNVIVAALAGLFLLLGILGGLPKVAGAPALLISLGLAALLLALSWIDLDRYILPDWLTLPLIVVGLLHAVSSQAHVWEAALGAVTGYGLIAGLAALWRHKFGREGIGLGDAKLLAGGGAWVGVFGLPIILLVASGASLAVAVLMFGLGKTTGAKAVLPFGPALSLGIWTVWCFPELLP